MNEVYRGALPQADELNICEALFCKVVNDNLVNFRALKVDYLKVVGEVSELPQRDHTLIEMLQHVDH